MTIRADLSALDHKYRAKRSGQSPIEYAASIQRFQPKAHLGRGTVAVIVVLLLAAVALKVAS